MAIIATANDSNKSFEPAPAGVHAAVCVDVVDKGMQDVTWQGETSQKHKIYVAWQIAENNEDGKPFMVFKTYTLSSHKKANLRKDIDSWFGPLTEAEARNYEVEAPLIGRTCMLNVVHNEANGKVYANVAGVMPLPKGMVAPEADYVRMMNRPAKEEEVAPQAVASPAKSARRVLSDEDIPS